MNEHIKTTCKIRQRAECCKYLIMGARGFECAKITESSKVMIDKAWAKTEHVSQGDNCDSMEDLK